MTRDDWDRIVTLLAADWPHQIPPDAAIDKWFVDLEEYDAQQVYEAVEAFYREGDRYPPTGGQIIARIDAANREDPDYGKAWEQVHEALWKYAPYHWTKFYESLPPLVAEAARRYGFETQGGYQKDEEGMVRAQFRDIYREVCDGARRHDARAGASRRVERGQPRRLGDVLGAALPDPDEEDDDE